MQVSKDISRDSGILKHVFWTRIEDLDMSRSTIMKMQNVLLTKLLIVEMDGNLLYNGGEETEAIIWCNYITC